MDGNGTAQADTDTAGHAPFHGQLAGHAVRRRALPYENIRWIVSDTDPATLTLTRDTKWVQDFKGNNLLLFGGEWNIAYTLKQNPGLELAEFSKN